MSQRKLKHNTLLGVFETKTRAEQAVADLKAAGFSDSDIGFVYRNAEGKTVKKGAADETYVEEGAVGGLIAGAAGGALVGAGILTGVIVPVVGPVLALGALSTVLLNAAGGAAIAGIAGALIGWGIPEEDAGYYEGEVKAGRFLVTVETKDREEEARSILHRYSGFDRYSWAAVRTDRMNTLAEGLLRTDDGREYPLQQGDIKVGKPSDRTTANRAPKSRTTA